MSKSKKLKLPDWNDVREWMKVARLQPKEKEVCAALDSKGNVAKRRFTKKELARKVPAAHSHTGVR